MKIKVFISSVQSEFAIERKMLNEYLTTDALLRRFFEPFIFENQPASNQRTDCVYLNEAKNSDIYIGLLGKEYGYEDEKGISPTESEYNTVTENNRVRLIFLTNHSMEVREKKEQQFIEKVEQEVVRKKFGSEIELKAGVYSALIKYLEEKAMIRTGPFDASICRDAELEDLDSEKIAEFVRTANAKRGFPLPDSSLPEKVLTHLNLIKGDGITNAAILLFGKAPQRFLISSEVKCVQFHGNKVLKPIPAYQVYKGDVFQLVKQAVDFVLSRIDVGVESRMENIQPKIEYEIPQAVIREAIVNAVAHRDYTSNGSIQVMLFRNRIEIWNPGELPHNLSLADLKTIHSSFPNNPLLADPLYLAGYIERLGTGTSDMVDYCLEAGIPEPEFLQEDTFKTIIRRRKKATGEVSGEATGEVPREVKRVILVLNGEMKRSEIQMALQLKHDDFFRTQYINPALNSGMIELKYPENITHPNQKYRLSKKGIKFKKGLSKG